MLWNSKQQLPWLLLPLPNYHGFSESQIMLAVHSGARTGTSLKWQVGKGKVPRGAGG